MAANCVNCRLIQKPTVAFKAAKKVKRDLDALISMRKQLKKWFRGNSQQNKNTKKKKKKIQKQKKNNS